MPWDGAINPDAFGAGLTLGIFVLGTVWVALLAVSILRRLLSADE